MTHTREKEMMAETEIPDWPRGITFEQVRAGFMEDRKRMEESNSDLDKGSVF